jgi:hypothetical protein
MNANFLESPLNRICLRWLDRKSDFDIWSKPGDEHPPSSLNNEIAWFISNTTK